MHGLANTSYLHIWVCFGELCIRLVPFCCFISVGVSRINPYRHWDLCQWRNLNSLRPRQNGRHFADDISNCISLIENISIPIKISLKFVPGAPISNIPALVQIMAWRRPGDKPLSGPMMISLPTLICVTRPQWVKTRLNASREASINL